MYSLLNIKHSCHSYRYVIKDSIDGTYGGPTGDGKNGTGMVGMVMRGVRKLFMPFLNRFAYSWAIGWWLVDRLNSVLRQFAIWFFFINLYFKLKQFHFPKGNIELWFSTSLIFWFLKPAKSNSHTKFWNTPALSWHIMNSMLICNRIINDKKYICMSYILKDYKW